MHLPPQPDPRELLPPLLACLPASFISPRPPPALLPLLAPVLRQRLNFLSGNSSNTRDGWLPLLSWGSPQSSPLSSVVEQMQIEPHPVSGEIELDDVASIKYRRLDQETLHARLAVEQFGLLPTYVWCENDEHGGTGPGWKLADLRAIEEDSDDHSAWHDSISEANSAATSVSTDQNGASAGSNGTRAPQPAEDDGDDDDYWAAYDRTPSQTPAQKSSPAPHATSSAGARGRSQSELEYFARYGDVQPAMDSHDPDEAEAAAMAGASSLQGDALVRQQARQFQEQSQRPPQESHVRPGNEVDGVSPPSMFPSDTSTATPGRVDTEISMPRPVSPPDSTHSSVDHLEREAATMTSPLEDRAQMGIKQHISTDIKSLYRLAKSVGMTRDDFTDIVTRELEVLSIMDQDD